MPEMAAFSLKWMRTVQELYDKRLLRPHPLVVRSGDWRDVLQGLQDVRAGRQSGKMLVYTI
jgi:hypothetical protein